MLKFLSGFVVGLIALTVLAVVGNNPDVDNQPVRIWQALLGLSAVAQAAFAGLALISLRYNRIAAEAANETLKHTQRIAELQLRAYVSHSETEVIKVSAGEPSVIKLKFKNSGTTPVISGGLRFRMFCLINGATLDDADNAEWDDLPFPPLTPGDETAFRIEGTRLGADRLAEIMEMRTRLICEYAVIYVDAFGNQRLTGGCVRISRESGEWRAWGERAGDLT